MTVTLKKSSANDLVKSFADRCNISVPIYDVVDKAGEEYLAIHVGKINHVFAEEVRNLLDSIDDEAPFAGHIYLKEVTPDSWLHSTECQLLQRVLAESLTVGKSTLESDFHRRYIPSLAGEEKRIFTKTNQIVYGRRGAGKSSLVLYACNQARQQRIPYAWIALQQYRGRSDMLVVPQVLYEVVDALAQFGVNDDSEIKSLRKIVYSLEEKGTDLTRQEVNTILPTIGRHLLRCLTAIDQFLICIDDLHLLHRSLQPFFLSCLYGLARGNNIFLKITAIENLTQLYDSVQGEGLQTPGDAQVIRLDRNLVDPSAAHQHVQNVLGGYVKYVGIPGLSSLCGSNVRNRLTWVSAGVPRDALYIFNNALTKAIAADRQKVAVTDINMAASDSLTEKEGHVSDDVGDDAEFAKRVVDDIKTFCLQEIRSNAFLVHIVPSDSRFQAINQIADLRFIHMLHPGITPEKAGDRYQAFMLDYAFYTGFRKAQSMTEFKTKPEQLLVKELRRLKTYKYEERIDLPPE